MFSVERAAHRKDLKACGARSDNDRVALLKIAGKRRFRGRILGPATAQGGGRGHDETQTQHPGGERASCIRKSGHESCLSRVLKGILAKRGAVYWVMNPILPA